MAETAADTSLLVAVRNGDEQAFVQLTADDDALEAVGS